MLRWAVDKYLLLIVEDRLSKVFRLMMHFFGGLLIANAIICLQIPVDGWHIATESVHLPSTVLVSRTSGSVAQEMLVADEEHIYR